MKSRLLNFLNKHKVFSRNQFGFVEGKSTEMALTDFVEFLYNSMNSKCKTSAVFIDFKKAFDMVDHNLLCAKLEKYGIRGIALNWFKSYLIDREQVCKFKNIFSTPKITKNGVPQGSVLSATLFLVFINDLLEQRFKGRITAFADDIAFSYSQQTKTDVWESINHDLKMLMKWCISNFMVVNVSKTKYINFDFRSFEFDREIVYHNVLCNTNVVCDCQKIEKVNSFKYLGICLDENLTWKTHITTLNSNLRRSIRTFYYLRNFCDTKLLKSLYYALIDSRLQYGIHCWGGAFQNLIEKLKKTQNQFIRVILFKKRRETSLPLFKELGILPLKYIFVFKILKLFYQRSGQFGVEQRYEHSHETRNFRKGSFRRPKVNKSFFAKSFVYLGPKFFNELPLSVKSSKNIANFSAKLKYWLIHVDNIQEIFKILK